MLCDVTLRGLGPRARRGGRGLSLRRGHVWRRRGHVRAAMAAAAGPGAGAAEDAFLTFYNEVPPALLSAAPPGTRPPCGTGLCRARGPPLWAPGWGWASGGLALGEALTEPPVAAAAGPRCGPNPGEGLVLLG